MKQNPPRQSGDFLSDFSLKNLMAKMCFFGGSIRLFINFSLWQRENVPLFSLSERKKFQKRSRPTCCWIAGEHGSRIPQSPVVSARTPARAQNCSLAENAEVFGRHLVLWGTLIARRLFFWCADGTASPPRAYFIPAEFGEITVLYLSKTYWGLNKPVGILAVLSMHPAQSARLPYALHDDKEPRAAKSLSSSG